LEVDGPGRESKNRYFVVLNRCPKTDTVLVLVTSTTKVGKKLEFVRRAGITKDTIVIVSPDDYLPFKDECAFNCNDVHEVCLSDLVRKIEKDGSDGYPKMPAGIINKLIKGVRVSPLVDQEIKNFV
jgi:hypothetical protein